MDAKQLGAGWQEGRMSDGNGLHHLTPQEIIIIIIVIIIIAIIIVIFVIIIPLNSINIMVMINNRYCQMSGTHLIDVAGSPSCNLIDLDTQSSSHIADEDDQDDYGCHEDGCRIKMTIVPIL